jgi:hypothetical protein
MDDKAMKLPTCDGKKSFVLYWTHMRAYARVHHFTQDLGAAAFALDPTNQAHAAAI